VRRGGVVATAIAAIAAAVLLVPTAAGAGTTKSASSTVTVDTVAGTPDLLFAVGAVDSSRPACVGNRRVRIELIPDSGDPVPFDVARSSEIGGGWLGTHPTADTTSLGPLAGVRAKVERTTRRLGKHKRLICKSANVVYLAGG
jgi:hypothetical protein